MQMHSTPLHNPPTRSDALSALHAIPSHQPRAEWLKIGMAAIAADLTVEDLTDWSRTAENFKSDSDVIRTFRNVKPDKGIGPGTLFHVAKQHGWVRPQDEDAGGYEAGSAFQRLHAAVLRNQGAQRGTAANAPTAGIPPAAAPTADTVWSQCHAAPGDHPYIVSKCGDAAGLRVVPVGADLKIMGHSMAGALVVPICRTDGSLSSLQFITPPETAALLRARGKPTKLNLPGTSMEGWHVVGTLQSGGTVHLCEGVGQAWACHQASGHASVVCFGWGRVAAVAKALRTHDRTARLVIVPDAGLEAEAEKVAATVGAAVAVMPAGSPRNFDANDLALRDGLPALAGLLDAADLPAPDHPLARFVELSRSPAVPRWIVPRFIAHGLTVIAGAHGLGKTTALLPLAMVVAGFHRRDDPLAPRHWRHVVYITEDTAQAGRIVSGMMRGSNLGLTPEAVNARLHLVEAERMEVERFVQVGDYFRRKLSRQVGGVQLPPLVVVDTKAAVLTTENENDNSEASRLMAALKQHFAGLPVWLIGHVAKDAAMPVSAAKKGVTARGSSAVEADANQVLYLVQEGEGMRYLVRGKTRFEATWPELQIVPHEITTEAVDEFGVREAIILRWGECQPPQTSRKAAASAAAETARIKANSELRQSILEQVQIASASGLPLNRAGLRSKLKVKAQAGCNAINTMIAEGWLHEVTIPAALARHQRQTSFLICLTAEERDTYLSGGPLPTHKTTPPPSRLKSP